MPVTQSIKKPKVTPAANRSASASSGSTHLATDTGVLSVAASGYWNEATGGPQAASVEDLIASATYSGTLAAGSAGEKLIFPIFVAPFPCRVTGMAFCNVGGALTLSGVNFWSFRPRRYRVTSSFASQFVEMISSTGTNFTITSNLLQGEVVQFNGITWSDTLNRLRAGDLMAVRFATSGSPSDLSNFVVTVRYEPL